MSHPLAHELRALERELAVMEADRRTLDARIAVRRQLIDAIRKEHPPRSDPAATTTTKRGTTT